MKMKTSELKGAALDWAVLAVECNLPGVKSIPVVLNGQAQIFRPDTQQYSGPISPSTSWMYGGPIIEREQIGLMYINHGFKGPIVYARIGGAESVEGPTPLIAAMRCYVASKLGDNINIPQELT